MSDDTTPKDGRAKSPASTGSGAKFRPIGAYVHTPTYEDLLEEVTRLRLTNAEREAVEWLTAGESPFADEEHRMQTLRGLLEKTR